MGIRLAHACLAAILIAGTAGAEPLRAPKPPPAEGLDSEGGAAGAPPGQPTVAAVELHLPSGTDPQGLASLVAVRQGAPLSRRAVRRSIERLFATGRFADVSAWEQPAGPGAVTVVLEATPRTYVDRVDFEGNRALTAEALAKAAGVGEQRIELYPELVERLVERLKGAYRRVGHGEAEVATELAEDRGLSVLTFKIKEGEPTRVAALTAAGDPELSIEEIGRTLQLGPGQVLDLDKLDRGVQALKTRYRAERHYRARVGTPEVEFGPQGAVVRLPVSAGPRLEFRVVGNRAFPEEDLLRWLGYDGEEALDEPMRSQLADKVASYYRLAGYPDVRVRAREVRTSGKSQSYVVFQVDEGSPLRVTALRFEGQQHFSAEFLRARVYEALAEVAPPEDQGKLVHGEQALQGGADASRSSGRVVDPLAVYYEPAYQQALGRILAHYRADGFLSASVGMPVLERDERVGEATATFQVREGPQTTVAEVVVEGAREVKVPERLAARPGRPLNSLDVETSRQSIQRAMGQAGYLYAKVEDQESLNADHSKAKVAFLVTPGPKVRVGRILVEGLRRTNEEVVRAALPLSEGGVLDPEMLAQSQRNLARLGIFNTASLRLDSPEVPEEVKDLFIAAEERKTLRAEGHLGYSFVDGPRMLGEFSWLNVLGRALQLQVQAKLNYFNASYLVFENPDVARYVHTDGTPMPHSALDALGRHVAASVVYPRILSLLPSEVGVRFDLVHERINRPAYGFTRNAGILSADILAAGGISATLQYGLESDDISRTAAAAILAALPRADIERLRFPYGLVVLHSLRPTVSWDLRDDPADPHRGLWLNASAEFVQALGGKLEDQSSGSDKPNSLFVKAQGQINGYLPLPRRAVLALSLRGGKIFPLDPESRTIRTKRFFLGGAANMRGYLEETMIPEDMRQYLHDEVRQCGAVLTQVGCTENAVKLRSGRQLVSEGGELFTLGRGELRIPLGSSFYLAFFLDAGNLWDDPNNYQPFKLRYSAGTGLRMVTPVGPASLDLGVNLSPDVLLNESRFQPHFSIELF